MGLPVIEAVVCFLRRGDETLLIDYTNHYRPLHNGLYSGPGGKIEPDESREDATRREMAEETKIVVRDLVYRGSVFFNNERRSFGGKPSKYNFKVYYFDSSDFDDSRAEAQEGSLAWTRNDSIPNLKMHEGDKKIWEWLGKHGEIDAEIIHVNEQLIDAKLISPI